MGYNQYETLKKKQKSKLLGVEGKNDFYQIISLKVYRIK